MHTIARYACAGALVAVFALLGPGASLAAASPISGAAASPVSGAAAVAAPGTARTGVDDFSFESYSADFFLGVDSAGRSTLTTVETFVATFPDIDQNHGMKRAIPEKYQGDPTDITVLSVTDENGSPRPFTAESDGDGSLVVTSASPSYVHGRQTYVFTYTQHNVTRFFSNTNDDEFYWDTNGTGWAQSFGSVSARVHVPATLATSLTAGSSCYVGYEGSTTACELSRADDTKETVFSTAVTEIEPYQNVTVAIAFTPHLFVPRDDSYFGSPLGVLQLLSVLLALVTTVWSIVVRATVLRNGTGRPTIIAEYDPPTGLDLFTAAILINRTSKAAAAQFIDFAVRGRMRIIDTPKEGFFAHGESYQFQLIDASGIIGPPLTLAQALFGPELTPGTTYAMTGTDTALSAQVRKTLQAATVATVTNGFRKKRQAARTAPPALLTLASTILTFVFGVSLLNGSFGGAIPFLLFIPATVVIFVVFALLGRVPLTDVGAELRDHLKGLELYIRLAEADRLRMLQSPTGAERAAVSATDPREVVKVYEKLLPYAVLFGLEKQWAAELGKYYTDASPDWYAGTGPFNAALFASSIGSISTTATNSYSGSSSSGGSGGGGSSGGGGGGGGGGGV
jgi:uncharacterized membrane protein YgcG